MRVWITRCALSQGIFEAEARLCSDINDRMIEYNRNEYAHGNDWHRTLEDALVRAEEMRKKKIASLRAKISKLEKLKFS